MSEDQNISPLLTNENDHLLEFEELPPVKALVFRRTRTYWWQFWRPKNTNKIREVKVKYFPRHSVEP